VVFSRIAAEEDLAQCALREVKALHRGQGDGRGEFERKRIGARADGRKGNGADSVRDRKLERPSIAGCEQLWLTPSAVSSNRSHGVNDIACRQLKAGCYFGVARGAAAQRSTRFEQFGAGCVVNRAIDPTAPEQGGVGGVDDRIDLEGRDIGAEGSRRG